MRFVSHMVTTAYISDDDKIKLLRTTIDYICSNMHVQLVQLDTTATVRYFSSAEFRQFTGAIDGVKKMLRFPCDETKVLRLASEAIKAWNFALKFERSEGRRLTNRVSLLRQIIDLFKNHHDDVWKKDEVDGQFTPCKIYNTSRDEYFRKHEHNTRTPHEPYVPESTPVEQPAAAESTDRVPLDALLLELHELSERDI